MEELKEKLEELISIKGTTDKEVLNLSQQLDDYIVHYYNEYFDQNCGHAI